MYLLVSGSRYQSNGEDVEFSKLVKRGDELICYQENSNIFTIGNPNWKNLSIEGGEFEIKVTKEEKLLLVNQQLSKQVNDLLIENKQNKEINKMLAQQINNINIKLNSRGDK